MVVVIGSRLAWGTRQSARNQKRKNLFVAQDEVEKRRDGMIGSIEARMKRWQQLTHVFTIRWWLNMMIMNL